MTERLIKRPRGEKYGPNEKSIKRPHRYGNPFKMDQPHPDTGLLMTRDDVCDLFEERVLPDLDVEALRDKTLVCNCVPERCHGHSILKKLDETKAANGASMIGHNSNPKLVAAASEINQEHEGMLAAIEDSETRARRIGQVLIDLKPALKVASVNLTDFCKEHLPFGKSAAYEFISIAKGTVTLQELNARKYSAPAEKPDGYKHDKYRGPSEKLAEEMVKMIFNAKHDLEWRKGQVLDWIEKAFDDDEEALLEEYNFIMENKHKYETQP